MIRLIKNISITIIVFSFLGANESNDFRMFPIELSVYDGQESILILWSVSDSIQIKEQNIFVKEFGEEGFELLAELSLTDSAFLDTNCKSGYRYFYKIEITDIFGKKYYSDSNTPPFGTCLIQDKKIDYKKDIQNIHDLILYHIFEKLAKVYSHSDLNSIKELLCSKIQSEFNWIEKFPLDRLSSIAHLIPIIDEAINDKMLVDEIMDYTILYRNHFYLNNQSWNEEIDNYLLSIRNDWELIYQEYFTAINDYALIAPIRILSCQKAKNNNNELLLNLYLFHPDQMESNNIYLLSNEEYIDILPYKNLESNHIFINIPDHWEYVDLMMNEVFVQSCPLIFDHSVIFTLKGDIVPMDYDLDTPIVMTINKTGFWLNELTWNPLTKKIGIEIAGDLNPETKYFITNQNYHLWDIDTPIGYGKQFFDSLLTLPTDILLPTTIELNTLENDSVIILEYIFLDTLPFAINRIPDGGIWHYSESYTLGATNKNNDYQSSQEFVPELFVLYQNYPNPFNGQTKISFNLLEEALVSLYITDATGRIHDKLIDEEIKVSGIYNYLWSGEGRSTGIYFITLVAHMNDLPPAVYSRKMIYLK